MSAPMIEQAGSDPMVTIGDPALVNAQSLINFYARAGFHHHINTVCSELLRKRGEDEVLSFWKGYSMLCEGATAEAMREFEGLKERPDIRPAALLALLHTHKQAKLVDQEAVSSIESQLNQVEGNMRALTERAVYQAACFLHHIGDFYRARKYLHKIINSSINFPSAHALAGWIELMDGKPPKAAQFFDNALTEYVDGVKKQVESSRRDLEALMGKAKAAEERKDYKETLEVLNQVVVRNAWFIPAVTEKGRILMAIGEWEQALEVAQRVLAKDPRNIAALQLLIMHMLCRESKYSEACSRINELAEALDRSEPKSSHLYYELTRPLVRVCGRNGMVLQSCLNMLEKARRLDSNNSAYVTEYAFIQTLQEDWGSAIKIFQFAQKLDETNINALHGVIKCKLMEGQLEEASHHLEFLNEISNTIEKSQEVMYLSALSAWKKDKNQEVAMTRLDEAIRIHTNCIENALKGYPFFVELNPEFLIEVTKEYLQHCGMEPKEPGDPPSPYLEKARQALELLVKNVPGHLEGQLLLARSSFICGDHDLAERCLKQCLALDPSYAEAHIIMAQIYFHQERYKDAQVALDQAVSHNFEVRSSPLYHIVHAKVTETMGNMTEALKLMEAAMQLPGIRRNAAPGKRGSVVRRSGQTNVPIYDRATVYLNLCLLQAKMNLTTEASNTMQEAINEFMGTSEDVRVTLTHAELCLMRGDVEQALGMLRAIEPSNPHFVRSRIALARVYLKYRKDRTMYIKCYREIAERLDNVHSYDLLGDAIMKIQDPDRAIQAYETALKKDLKNSALASKIGKALITTHDFDRAENYYATAVHNDPSNTILCHDLAELYIRMKNHIAAGKVIKDVMKERARNRVEGSEDLSCMIDNVKSYMLLSKVHIGLSETDEAVEAMNAARKEQQRIISRTRNEQIDAVRDHKLQAAKICHTLGEYYEKLRQYDKAKHSYTEALKFDNTHEKSMLALSKLHLRSGDLDACQSQCVALMRLDSSNEEGSVMLADLLFRKRDYDQAIYQFEQLLEKKPNNYVALHKMMQLLRRAGRLDEAPNYFKLIEKNPRHGLDPGLHYCKGIYKRWTNDPAEALRELNLARKDAEWGHAAICGMIETYINPDNENMWEDIESRPDNVDALQAAERLIEEASRGGTKSMSILILEGYLQLASRRKEMIDQAVVTFGEVVSADRDNIPALLGLAMAFMMQKQTAKARGPLKHIAKAQFNPAEADEFEKAYLMLADISIQAQKNDQAEEMCKKALNENQSCAQAWEFLGLIKEKDGLNSDAADAYATAFKLHNYASASVGYKLAYNFLKSKRFVECIDVCHKVLEQYPDYPKIQREVLEKARSNLRP